MENMKGSEILPSLKTSYVPPSIRFSRLWALATPYNLMNKYDIFFTILRYSLVLRIFGCMEGVKPFSEIKFHEIIGHKF
jgi:hypothetical protein